MGTPSWEAALPFLPFSIEVKSFHVRVNPGYERFCRPVKQRESHKICLYVQKGQRDMQMYYLK